MSALAGAATLPPQQVTVLLLQLATVIALAGLLGRATARLGMPAVAGELLAGVALGPTLGARLPQLAWLHLTDPGQLRLLDAVGQISVVLLIGLTGAEMDLSAVRARLGTTVSVGVGGLVVPVALGAGAGFLLPEELVPHSTGRSASALFLGAALGLSSLPVLAKILTDLRLAARPIGQLALSAAVFDDVCGWLLLGAVTALTTGSALVHALWLLPAAALLAVAAVGGARYAVLRLRLRRPDTGRLIQLTVVALLVCAAGSQAAGFEAMLGAFLCGTVLAAAPGATARLAPLRTFVTAVPAPLFFALAGLRMDLSALARPMVLLSALGLLVVAICGKFAGVYLGALPTRTARWERLALAACLNARGIVGIVVAATGLRAGLLSPGAYTVVVLVALVTSLMAGPLLVRAVARGGRAGTPMETLPLTAPGGSLPDRAPVSPERMRTSMVSTDQVRELALSLPEAEEQDHRGRPSFRIRGRIFTTLWPDAGIAVIKAPADEVHACVEASPETFEILTWGQSEFLKVHLKHADRDEVAELVTEAWAGQAPKSLVERHVAER
ncbi:cation:proton antiporter [Streptomyces sp. MspMP-M5]|uniref:cation:proton antiporter domain-containing protein n=1 Tax=unclassified Streptomyces TaxID=2593676 RepID=UPI0003A1BC52|nr:cation:proton antiporter [Streptomyces sp. MspMP-M5]